MPRNALPRDAEARALGLLKRVLALLERKFRMELVPENEVKDCMIYFNVGLYKLANN